MGLWIIASPAEVGWYGLGFDVIGYAISAATPFILLYFVGPKIVRTVPDKATLPQYIKEQYGISYQGNNYKNIICTSLSFHNFAYGINKSSLNLKILQAQGPPIRSVTTGSGTPYQICNYRLRGPLQSL